MKMADCPTSVIHTCMGCGEPYNHENRDPFDEMLMALETPKTCAEVASDLDIKIQVASYRLAYLAKKNLIKSNATLSRRVNGKIQVSKIWERV